MEISVDVRLIRARQNRRRAVRALLLLDTDLDGKPKITGGVVLADHSFDDLALGVVAENLVFGALYGNHAAVDRLRRLHALAPRGSLDESIAGAFDATTIHIPGPHPRLLRRLLLRHQGAACGQSRDQLAETHNPMIAQGHEAF